MVCAKLKRPGVARYAGGSVDIEWFGHRACRGKGIKCAQPQPRLDRWFAFDEIATNRRDIARVPSVRTIVARCHSLISVHKKRQSERTIILLGFSHGGRAGLT